MEKQQEAGFDLGEAGVWTSVGLGAAAFGYAAYFSFKDDFVPLLSIILILVGIATYFWGIKKYLDYRSKRGG